MVKSRRRFSREWRAAPRREPTGEPPVGIRKSRLLASRADRPRYLLGFAGRVNVIASDFTDRDALPGDT